ncbi:hypothetical protein Tco_1417921 [Tanacetum coccineum]
MCKTQSTRLEESVPNLNKGNTSSEVELGIKPHVLNLVQIHDLFADSEEELPSFSSPACSSSPSDIGYKDVDNIKNVTERILSRNLQWCYEVLFAHMETENVDRHIEDDASYTNLIAKEYLQADSELKEKVKSLIGTNLNNSRNLAEVTQLLKRANLPNIITFLEDIQGVVNQQNAHYTTLARSIKSLT